MNSYSDEDALESSRSGSPWFPSGVAAVALIASPCAIASLATTALRSPYVPCTAEASTGGSFCNYVPIDNSVVASSARSDTGLDRYADPRGFIRDTLASNGMVADRISETGDESLLIQFNSGRPSCVDVYPNGDVIVIVPNGDFTDTYELDVDDVELLLTVLRDAGLHH